MAYVSHVIDELEDEIRTNTSRVTDYLADSLRIAELAGSFDFRREVDSHVYSGEPQLPGALRFKTEGVLSFWDRLRWGSLSVATQWRILRSTPRYAEAVAAYDHAVHYYEMQYLSNKAAYDRRVGNHLASVARHNVSMRHLVSHSANGDPDAMWEIGRRRLTEFFHRAEFLLLEDRTFTLQPQSKRLLMEVVLPDTGTVPKIKSVRFLKTTGEHRYTYRSDAEVRRIYGDLVAQMVLAVINAAFECMPEALVETVVVNGVIIGPDPSTGVTSRVPVISVSTYRDKFESIQLAGVDATACLKYLSAAVSRNPAEAVPVRPVVRFDTSDPRFIQESDVLGGLDARPNLLDLTPGEFESLIQNLFTAMGLDTKQTQASRDGGVDAVAFDHRPVLGGKVIIQAKRYKNTVGVSAVRDLFGAVMNEGASKGILVTTSGYGKASFDFANGKPLELLDGPNLLHLLKEHAGIDGRIVVPENWVEPSHHGDT